MNLKNYTSTVPVVNSINRIEHRLIQAGAQHIAKSYENERPTGIVFQISVNNLPMTFKLPAKAERVYMYMVKQRSRPAKKSVMETIRMQSDRTAWKILADWVDIQISIIQLDQAEPIEVFLPYLYDGITNQTFFEKLKENNFKQLTGGKQ